METQFNQSEAGKEKDFQYEEILLIQSADSELGLSLQEIGFKTTILSLEEFPSSILDLNKYGLVISDQDIDANQIGHDIVLAVLKEPNETTNPFSGYLTISRNDLVIVLQLIKDSPNLRVALGKLKYYLYLEAREAQKADPDSFWNDASENTDFDVVASFNLLKTHPRFNKLKERYPGLIDFEQILKDSERSFFSKRLVIHCLWQLLYHLSIGSSEEHYAMLFTNLEKYLIELT
ncbi:hypothetical protein GYA49_00390 [Candidatus Beckwithbacteria bacterium]|nr:hypothetical protein [Candidatus Beckwithbacteria bacterium]